MSLNIDKLTQIQLDKQKANEAIYNTIYNRCKKQIEFIASNSIDTQCTFEIPTFILGYPPINLNETMKYLLTTLNQQVYAQKIDNKTIYISWNLDNIKK
jgi:hypothetical protein